jgi:hypothetical protein
MKNFLNFQVEHQFKSLGVKIGRDIIANWVENQLEEQKNLFFTKDFGIQYHSNMKIRGTKPQDFQNKLLDLDDGRQVIAGIRFVGLNPNRPFIDITTDYLFQNNHDKLELRTSLEEAFPRFRVNLVRFRGAPEFFEQSGLEWIKDMSWWAGDIAKSAQKTKAITDLKIEIKKLDPSSIIHFLQDNFEILHNRKPELRDHVTCADIAPLMNSYDQGLCYGAYFDSGILVGMISAIKSDFLGIKAIKILEELVFTQYRGKGLGKLLQYEFTKSLASKGYGDQKLFGSIHHLNTPSARVASSNHRFIHYQDRFLDLSERVKN